jgi:hypothetical protein
VRSVDYVEIPGCELAFDEIASAGVIMASLFVVRDGRLQDSLERIQRWKALTEKHGGKTRDAGSGERSVLMAEEVERVIFPL